jgi:hypothetical protein
MSQSKPDPHGSLPSSHGSPNVRGTKHRYTLSADDKHFQTVGASLFVGDTGFIEQAGDVITSKVTITIIVIQMTTKSCGTTVIIIAWFSTFLGNRRRHQKKK